MIRVEKSQPAPPCLEKEKRKASGDYKCDGVLERIKEDFFNKCYICECKEPATINVEHFKPHRGDIDKKFDWNNLFWSCGHCNNIKSDRHDNILDCTNRDHDVENWLRYEMKPFPFEDVKITSSNIQNDCAQKVENTVLLLSRIYNGTTELKIIESQNIRDKLLDEIIDFQQALKEYYEDCLEDDERERVLRKIKRHLKRTSAFTAFKRWIVKENKRFKKDFGDYLND